MNETILQAAKHVNSALTLLEGEFEKQVSVSMGFTPYQMMEYLTKKGIGKDLKELAKITTKLNSLYQDMKNA